MQKNNRVKELRLLFLTLTSSCVLFIAHILGYEYHLYWTIKWFDILVHSLGGIIIGLVMVSFREINKYILFSGSFCIIIFWELFEFYIVKIKVLNEIDFIIDTILDVFIGFSLSIIVFYFFKKLFN